MHCYATTLSSNCYIVSFTEGNSQLVFDDLFQSWSSELGIPIMPEEDTDKARDEEIKNILDWTSFKELEYNAQSHLGMSKFDLLDFTHSFGFIWKLFIGLEEIELTNKIKFEPESPSTQFPLSPNSLNHSESNDSDKQVRRSIQKLSNCGIKTEVYIAVCTVLTKDRRVILVNFFLSLL